MRVRSLRGLVAVLLLIRARQMVAAWRHPIRWATGQPTNQGSHQ